jgi:hypothetical protein
VAGTIIYEHLYENLKTQFFLIKYKKYYTILFDLSGGGAMFFKRAVIQMIDNPVAGC